MSPLPPQPDDEPDRIPVLRERVGIALKAVLSMDAGASFAIDAKVIRVLHGYIAGGILPGAGEFRSGPASNPVPRPSADGYRLRHTAAANPRQIEEELNKACLVWRRSHQAIRNSAATEEQRAWQIARSSGWLLARILRAQPFDHCSEEVALLSFYGVLYHAGYDIPDVDLGTASEWLALSGALTYVGPRTITAFADRLAPRLHLRSDGLR